MVRKRLRCGDYPCYVRDALRGAGTPRRGARLRVAAVGSAVLAMAVLLAACGESSSDSNQQAGNYEVKVTSASFAPKQVVGQTSLLKIDARNTGEHPVPDLTVTVDIEGKYGEAARIPFAVHDPQPGLANGDRPVWVLAATYPRLGGSKAPGGTFVTQISTALPETEVNGAGEIVEIKPDAKQAGGN